MASESGRPQEFGAERRTEGVKRKEEDTKKRTIEEREKERERGKATKTRESRYEIKPRPSRVGVGVCEWVSGVCVCALLPWLGCLDKGRKEKKNGRAKESKQT